MAPGRWRDTDKMTFLEHLDELRVRLLRSMVAIVVALGVCWNWSPQILHFIMQPLKASFPTVTFITTGPTEGFSLHVKAAFLGGVFLAAPFVLYQVWAFISPGLYAHEKRWVVPFVGLGSVFFVLGGVFGHWVLFPATFRFLGQYTTGEIQYFPRLSEYFSFYFWFIVGLGVVFQLPVLILVLARLGLVTPGFLLGKFKFAVLAAFIISAVITPSGDVVNQTMLAAPIIGLYLLGVGVAWLFGKRRGLERASLALLAMAFALEASARRANGGATVYSS
jgi:sec-independent protein translocase protein TatC